ncbi:MAG: hypothetical protein JO297_13150 [Nitrososphaeraceae archaeon]|nr:hypothetical protein [Nitrososphaeraceae archaeon]
MQSSGVCHSDLHVWEV